VNVSVCVCGGKQAGGGKKRDAGDDGEVTGDGEFSWPQWDTRRHGV
jgi:hypothetical protein